MGNLPHPKDFFRGVGGHEKLKMEGKNFFRGEVECPPKKIVNGEKIYIQSFVVIN